MVLREILLVALVSVAFAHGKSVKDSDSNEIAKLVVFVGKWKTAGEVFNTKFSHAAKTSSIMTCVWSPNRRFLISDQIIKKADGTVDQLGVYGYDPHAKGFYSYTFFGAGGAPFSSKPVINGNVWIYNGEFKSGGETIKTRTTNDFILRDTMTFETQYSEDGTHWVTMMKGKDVRIK